MANLKEVRNRISSVNSTQQITKAMKLVAASKLKRAQDRITQMRPYANKLGEMMGNIMAGVEEGVLDLDLATEREAKKVLLVLITSDRGLCGGFNANLIKTARGAMETYSEQLAAGNLTLMTIGKKGYDAFNNKVDNLVVDDRYRDMFATLDFNHVSKAAENVIAAYESGEYDKVQVIFGEFKNAATQIFQVADFLPIQPIEAGEGEANNDFIFEPEKGQLVNELVPKILKTQFYRYLLDSNASEMGARMVAMDQATENAKELLSELKLIYNRERQAAITGEILEIVGGAAALEAG